MKTAMLAEFQAHQSVLEQTVASQAAVVEQVSQVLVECFRCGGRVLLCGNGGSAADAQHVAGEFVNRFRYDRPALPAIALTTDTSILTCIGNDSSFEQIFARQVEALGRPGDVLVGISTSGASPNVLRALQAGRAAGLTVITFTGEKGAARLAPLSDLCLAVASSDTPRIQECHIFLWHVICGQVEQALFPPASQVGRNQP